MPIKHRLVKYEKNLYIISKSEVSINQTAKNYRESSIEKEGIKFERKKQKKTHPPASRFLDRTES
jgi:hypothetical protein